MKICPMDKDFILFRCLHNGPLSPSNIEAKSMNIKERLQTIEVLWESLRYDEVDIDSPDWHEDILKERMYMFGI